MKFNFMYLTEVCTEPGEKEAIYAHLRGLWEHPEFVRRNHGIDAFRLQ